MHPGEVKKALAHPPLFSVITPSLNCIGFLPKNLESVRSQGLPPEEIEHWVIDGGSSDGTVEFLKQAPHVRFISEKDRGLSDAVNKGIQRSTGQWIIWLNADDRLAEGALPAFLEHARSHPDIKVFCGDQIILGYDGTVEGLVPGWDYNLGDLLGTRTGINQASTFVHRGVYRSVGLLDVSIHEAMDYEWTVRAMQKFRCTYIPHVLTYYQRRPGSIMDARMADHFRTFLSVRRRYGKSPWSLGEWRIRFYIWTEPLRRIHWLRRAVRRIKHLFGKAPTHPMS